MTCPQIGTPLYDIDLYEDIPGRYSPKLEEKDSVYIQRRYEHVKLVRIAKEGGRREMVNDSWPELLKKVKRREKKPFCKMRST